MKIYEDSVDVDSTEHETFDDTFDDELDDDEHCSVSSGDEMSEDSDDGSDKCNGDGDAGSFDSELRFDSISAEQIRSMEFSSISEAYDFYWRYGKHYGFAIRRSDSRKSKDNQMIAMKMFVCNKSGLRDKKHIGRLDRKYEHRRVSRTNCKARLRVKYKADKGKYVVSIFEEGHNHELTPARFVHLHPLYRNISEADKAQIDALHTHGIRTCHIMGYMVAQKGGYAGVGFTKKDLYNYFDKKMRAIIKDGDVAAALNYINVKSSTDAMLYAEYSVNESDGTMKTIFWADGISRSDYFCFGDVLAFDTTYQRNKYNYPLVIFSGCNHHSQTIIFGCALVSDETTETYKWVLRCFLECMEGKQPTAVVTDGDGSMREAIKHIFPDATHRLCAWHLNRNAGVNVKDSRFLEGFQKAMYSNFSKAEFEDYWSQLVKDNGLEKSTWVAKTYRNKSLWATAYLRDHFFGRIRTTSQCEAVNAIIKNYVRKKATIFEFMHNFDEALRGYRNNELVADFKSATTNPLLTTQLPAIEGHAAKIYTADIFSEVKHQILKAGELIVMNKTEVGVTKIYRLTKFKKDGYERSVVCNGTTFQCSCKMFDSSGIPCSHIFCVMKEEHVDEIPSNLILSRWTKDAKIQYLNSNNYNDTVGSNIMEQARFGSYCSVLTDFCREASKKEGIYGQIMEDIIKLKQKYCGDDNIVAGTQKSAVGDPVPVKCKGAPKRKNTETKSVRRRSKCNNSTHSPRRCSGTQQTTEQAGEADVDLDSVSISDSVSQIAEKKKKKIKTSANGERSEQNKSTYPPRHRGTNVTTTTTTHMESTSTGRHVNPTYGVQPLMPGVQSLMPTVHPMIQSMHPMYGVQPLMPMYGLQPVMNVGQNSSSCYGLLQQVMKSAKHE